MDVLPVAPELWNTSSLMELLEGSSGEVSLRIAFSLQITAFLHKSWNVFPRGMYQPIPIPYPWSTSPVPTWDDANFSPAEPWR